MFGLKSTIPIPAVVRLKAGCFFSRRTLLQLLCYLLRSYLVLQWDAWYSRMRGKTLCTSRFNVPAEQKADEDDANWNVYISENGDRWVLVLLYIGRRNKSRGDNVQPL